ncbi:MAG: CoA transferase [bacterium]|nr:CoA transferase [bacterium]MCP5065838.1 CoA transferase [bacterium]
MIDPAQAWARQLADALLPGAPLQLATPGEPAASAWARSGALWLTGWSEKPPVLPSVPLPSCMDGAVAVLRALAPEAELDDLDGAALLGEHAALAGLGRRGRISPGGSARLLPAVDGWLVANLPRDEDLRSLPAWLGIQPTTGTDVWGAVAAGIAARPLEELIERAHLLGIAVDAVRPAGLSSEAPWLRVAERGPSGPPCNSRPLVVDLSSLWAGPLCADLLRRCGATVWKVESIRRPDGARAGPPAFFDLLNAGKASVALDLGDASGRAALRKLVDAADVVIEASRPRALEQLGIDAAAWVRKQSGRIWLSLTAYGLGESARDRVGFGDDVAAAAGLAWSMTGGPLFVADAPADPLTAVHAAVAVLAARRRGESCRLDVSLASMVAAVCAMARDVQQDLGHRILKPRARAASEVAHVLGADTEEALAAALLHPAPR